MSRRLAGAAVILLAAASVAATLALLELVLRTLAPQPLGLSHRTREGLVLHVPNADVRYARSEFDHRIRINSIGLRDREVAIPKPAGTFRVLVLGDSYAEAKQVPLEEAFSERLEASLAAAYPGRRHEVVNGGVSGYGTADELRFYEILGRRLEPDAVVLAFAAGNDLEDNWSSRFFAWRDGRLEERPVKPLSEGERRRLRLREELASRFHLYQFFRDRYHSVRWMLQPRREEVLREHRAGAFARDWDEETRAAWAKTEALLARLHAAVRADGLRMLLVAIPLRMQVDDPEWQAFASATPHELDRDAVQARLRDAAARMGIPFLDLLPALREAHAAARAYYEIDGHLNARGHAITAARLLDALREHALLPSPPRPRSD